MDHKAFDSTLTVVALVEAYMARDKDGVDALLSDQSQHTDILSTLLSMFELLLISASGGEPDKVLNGLRTRLLNRLTEGD